MIDGIWQNSMAVPSFRGTCLPGPLLHGGRTPLVLFVDTRLLLAASSSKQPSRAAQLGHRARAQRVIQWSLLDPQWTISTWQRSTRSQQRLWRGGANLLHELFENRLHSALPRARSLFDLRGTALWKLLHSKSICLRLSSSNKTSPDLARTSSHHARRPHGCNGAASAADCRSSSYSSRV